MGHPAKAAAGCQRTTLSSERRRFSLDIPFYRTRRRTRCSSPSLLGVNTGGQRSFPIAIDTLPMFTEASTLGLLGWPSMRGPCRTNVRLNGTPFWVPSTARFDHEVEVNEAAMFIMDANAKKHNAPNIIFTFRGMARRLPADRHRLPTRLPVDAALGPC